MSYGNFNNDFYEQLDIDFPSGINIEEWIGDSPKGYADFYQMKDEALEFKQMIEDSNIENMGWDMKRIPFEFVNQSNSTCDIEQGAAFSDREADQYLMTANGYTWTTQPLKMYYKPNDVFVCCYESPTYQEIYSDGYGLNFYTREYGYYEYNGCGEYYDQIRSVAGVLAVAILIGFCCVIGCICYCCCKKKN